jgi:hypothetical protein
VRAALALILAAGFGTLSMRELDADASSPCAGRAFVTVTKNASGRVLRARRAGPDGARSYGCLYKFDNRVRLDDPDGEEFSELAQPQSIRMAGWLVGYARDSIGGFGLADEGWTDLIVRSLHPRSRLRRTFRAEPEEELRRECTDDCDRRSVVTDIVLRGAGAVAWIVCPFYEPAVRKRRCSETTAASVYKADSTARKRVRLDHAAGIDIYSLRLNGSTLSWTRDGKQQRARLR